MFLIHSSVRNKKISFMTLKIRFTLACLNKLVIDINILVTVGCLSLNIKMLFSGYGSEFTEQ